MLDAITSGFGLTVARHQRFRVDHFDLAPVLGVELRRRHARWLRGEDDPETAVICEALTPSGKLRSRTAELLRRAIEDRQAVIAAEDEERRGRWILEGAATLEDSLSADALRLKARRAVREARVRAAQGRASAFRWESLAHLSRLGAGPSETERSLRAALETYVWAEAWRGLAERAEPHQADVVDVWERAHAQISAELAALFGPPEGPLVSDEERARVRHAIGAFRRYRGGGSAVGLGGGRFGEYDSPFAAFETEDEAHAPIVAGEAPASARVRLAPAHSPMSAPAVPDAMPAISFAEISRVMGQIAGGPRSATSNAWCALCRAEFELPPSIPIVRTACGGCRQLLIPHEPDSPRYGRIHEVGTCPHCSHRVVRQSVHRHVRCDHCGTAVAPVPSHEP